MSNWPIIKQLAEIFGLIIRGLFIVLSYVGIENVALCILLFVLISKIIILPSTYHKHKLTLLAPKIEPEVRVKMKKYENKLEHPMASSKLNIDKGIILDKYGVMSSSGCLMTLLQLPVLFALYAVVQDVDVFIPELKALSETAYANAFTLFSVNILDVPGFDIGPKYIFPILAAVLQLIETLQMSYVSKTVNNGKLVGGISNALMLAMTFYFTASLPIICGIYWISRSLVDILVTFVLQTYIKSKDLAYFQRLATKKKNRNRIKRGLEPLTT